MRIGVLGVAVGLLCWTAAPCEAAVIRLKNGNTLRGEILESTEQEVSIDLPGVGAMTFPRTDIQSMDTGPEETFAATPPVPPAPTATALPQSGGSAPDAADEAPNASSGSAREVGEPDCKTTPLNIVSFSVRLSRNGGLIEGYAIFQDKNGQACKTSGSIQVSKTVTETRERVQDCWGCVDKETYEETRERSLKSIAVRPEDFEGEVRSGGQCDFRLPFRFSPNDVQRKDALTFTWRAFKVQQNAAEPAPPGLIRQVRTGTGATQPFSMSGSLNRSAFLAALPAWQLLKNIRSRFACSRNAPAWSSSAFSSGSL